MDTPPIYMFCSCFSGIFTKEPSLLDLLFASLVNKALPNRGLLLTLFALRTAKTPKSLAALSAVGLKGPSVFDLFASLDNVALPNRGLLLTLLHSERPNSLEFGRSECNRIKGAQHRKKY